MTISLIISQNNVGLRIEFNLVLVQLFKPFRISFQSIIHRESVDPSTGQYYLQLGLSLDFRKSSSAWGGKFNIAGTRPGRAWHSTTYKGMWAHSFGRIWSLALWMATIGKYVSTWALRRVVLETIHIEGNTNLLRILSRADLSSSKNNQFGFCFKLLLPDYIF